MPGIERSQIGVGAIKPDTEKDYGREVNHYFESCEQKYYETDRETRRIVAKLLIFG